jgi:hypothetical protein
LEPPLPLPPHLLRQLLAFLEVPVLPKPEDGGGGALAGDAADRRSVAGASFLLSSESSSRMRPSRASRKVGKG